MTRPALSLAVVGAHHPNEEGGVPRKFEIEMCSPGERVELVPEPNNPADERAIAVYSARGIQIGYLTAERAPLIGSYMARGEIISAVFQEATSWGAYIRAAFDGEEPVLPPARPKPVPPDDAVDPNPGFYPDEVWEE